MAAEGRGTVGVLGAGRMGLPIIGHLAAKGFTVLVHDVDDSKEVAVAERGGRFVRAREEIAGECETILVCVGYEEQLRETMLGDEGMLGALREGAVVAVLS